MIVFVFVIYISLIVYLIIGSQKVRVFTTSGVSPQNGFTIIVPFKNEAHNLPQLIRSIEAIDYPQSMFEVLFVDDSSVDGYVVPQDLNFKYKIFYNDSKTIASKKASINIGIENATYPWIVTTDADCQLPKRWLSVLNDFIENHPKARMICSMVFIQKNPSFIADFQQLDFMSLQSTTIGTFGQKIPFMCNGANFAYQKAFFQDLEGFKGNEYLASGDDVFLLQKAISTQKESVFYLKSADAVVYTKAVNLWSELVEQRIRWGGKTKAYSSPMSKLMAVIVVLSNFLTIYSWFDIDDYGMWIVLKMLVDYWLIAQVQPFTFRVGVFSTILSLLVYPFVSSYIFLKIMINRGKYVWK